MAEKEPEEYTYAAEDIDKLLDLTQTLLETVKRCQDEGKGNDALAYLKCVHRQLMELGDYANGMPNNLEKIIWPQHLLPKLDATYPSAAPLPQASQPPQPPQPPLPQHPPPPPPPPPTMQPVYGYQTQNQPSL